MLDTMRLRHCADPIVAKRNTALIVDAALEIDQLRAALKDCADDLEVEVEARYSHGIKDHPAMTQKYERDMEPVRRARQLLG